MAFLRTIDVFPPTGLVDRPWRDDPEEDAFVRSSRRVCERYSEALREHVTPLADRVSRLTILTARHDSSRAELEVDVDGPPRVAEWATVFLPTGVAGLAPDERAQLVLEVIDLSMRTLAVVRGWDPEAVARARRHVEAHGLGYTCVGAWRSNPSRSLRARLWSELADDGYGRSWVEVAERPDGRLLRRGGPYLGYSTREGLRRADRTLRWKGSDVVEVVPFVDLLGDTRGKVAVDLRSGEVGDVVPEGAPPSHVGASARPEVRLREETPQQAVHEIFVGGGGTYDARCHDYLDAVYRYLGQLDEDPWLRWWSASPVLLLQIHVWTSDKPPAVTARRSGVSARAAIRRRAADMGSGATALAAAKADVHALVALLRRRFDLGPAPVLREGAALGIHAHLVESTRSAYAGPFHD